MLPILLLQINIQARTIPSLLPRSQRQVVAVLVLHILRQPEDNRAEPNKAVGYDILHAHAERGPADARDDELEDKDGDAAGHAAGQGREAQKQHDAGLPGHARARVAKRVRLQPRLLHRVDDEHAQGREDERQPVHKGDVHVGAVVGGFRPHGRVEEDVEGEGELFGAGLALLMHFGTPPRVALP